MTPLAHLLVFALFPQPLHAQDLSVMFFRPSTLDPVFGEVEVEVDVQAPEGVTVDLFVDGARVGSMATPPYVWTVDVGRENIEHRFKAVAVGHSGVTKTTSISTPAIHVDESIDVNLRQLYVTVSRGDRRVLDLDEADFRVFDAGSRQDIVTFARGDVPITAALLLDASESMQGERFEAALRGGEAFAHGMRDLDEAKLILFSDLMLESTPFTNEAVELMAPLRGVEASGNTSVNDHLYLALRLLDVRQGRRVVVLFTDGADLHSVLPMEDVLWVARRSQALIYWIRLEENENSPRFSTSWRDADGNAVEVAMLEKAVRESGGRIEVINRVSAVESAFRGIMDELREQYVLGYYPSRDQNDGSWREVTVDVGHRNLQVRSRDGYVDD